MSDAAYNMDDSSEDASAPGPNPGRVRSLDLTGSQRHLRSALGTLSAIAEAFGRNARRTLPFLLRQRVRFHFGEPAIGDPTDSTAAKSGPSYVVTLAGQDANAWASLTLNGPCLARLLEGSLGNSQVSEGASLGERLTLAQKVLIAKIATRLGDDFAEAIRKEIGLSFEVTGGQAADQDEEPDADGKDRKDAIYIELNLEGEDNQAGLVLAVGADVLDEAVRGSDVQNAPKGDPRMAEAILAVEVPLIAELGRLSLGLGRVLGLKKGQVLRLPTLAESAVPVTINGIKKFYGSPITSRGQLAVQIIDLKTNN